MSRLFARPTLKLKLLGPADVRVGERPVAGQLHNKMLALLAYLAVEQRPQAREHLSGFLWPDLTPDAARSNLRGALYRIGLALGDTFLDLSRDAAALVPQRYRLDVADFLAPLPADMAYQDMEAQLKIYGGAFLEGRSFDNAPDFSDWLLAQRERCHRQALILVEGAIASCETRGDFNAALRHADTWLALEPWSETAHRKSMALLAQNGRREAALAQYENFRRILDKELGVPPAAPTRELFESIRDGRFAPAVARAYSFPVVPTPLNQSLNILIVDDHVLFRAGLAVMLHGMGSEVAVFEADSCEAALSLPKTAQGFDLIVLDIGLAGMSGIDGMRLFRDHHPTTPVMLCSGNESVATIRTAYRAGAQGFLSKSMSAADTQAAIGKVLNGETFFPFGFVEADR